MKWPTTWDPATQQVNLRFVRVGGNWMCTAAYRVLKWQSSQPEGTVKSIAPLSLYIFGAKHIPRQPGFCRRPHTYLQEKQS